VCGSKKASGCRLFECRVDFSHSYVRPVSFIFFHFLDPWNMKMGLGVLGVVHGIHLYEEGLCVGWAGLVGQWLLSR
jgi:hypothetical protein